MSSHSRSLPDRERVKTLLSEALALQVEKRETFLIDATGDDTVLLAEVVGLLEALEKHPTLLAAPTRERDLGGSHMEPAELETAGTLIGRYKLLQKIGSGGFGVVWMAEQQEPVVRKVALKILKLGMDTRHVITRFEAERQALAMMDHENIAKVFDGGATTEGRPYFVMELVKGVPITAYCDNARLGTKKRLELFMRVCHALQHAHQKGIIHRDIKPDNVLVTLHDGEPVPKVIDFGIAKAIERPLTEKTLFTEFQQVIGTPEYMSPEQAELSGLDIDTRADVYSLGVLLYELLTGTRPFESLNMRQHGFVEMMRIIREDDPQKPSTRISTMGDRLEEIAGKRGAPPRQLGKLVRGDLDWIVMRSLEKDRRRRYQTARGLALDVQRHLDCMPVEAGPPSAAYRLSKMIRKHSLEVASGVLVLAVLIAGLITSWSFYLRAEGEAIAKESERRKALASQDYAIRQEGIAKRERNRAQLRLDNFDRLAASVKLDLAKQENRKLFPAWPEMSIGLAEWLSTRGEELKTEWPKLRGALASLRQRALPESHANWSAYRKVHPQAAELVALGRKLKSLDLAFRVQKGQANPTITVLPESAPKDLDSLNDQAFRMVMPDRKPKAYGQEALALAYARRAVELATEDRHLYLDTLAWALLANGLTKQALATSQQALIATNSSTRPSKREVEEMKGYLASIRKHILELEESLSQTRQLHRTLVDEIDSGFPYRFENEADLFLYGALTKIEKAIRKALSNQGLVTEVRRRLDWSNSLKSWTGDHPKAGATWQEAAAAIVKADGKVASALYAAQYHRDHPILLEPQVGLVPIGMNPITKLWEFYHLRSALDQSGGQRAEDIVIPAHDAMGRIRVTDGMGIIFVLVPGGTYWKGAQGTDSNKPNYDKFAKKHETPRRVTVGPCFVARHEMTQGQWKRLSGGEEPSRYNPKLLHWRGGEKFTLSNPVDSVSWIASTQLLVRFGLCLPDSKTWEYACRAGESSPWYTGAIPSSLKGHANLKDASANRVGMPGPSVPFDDHRVGHAPVGTYRANAFGLFDVHGNVWEWCADRFSATSTDRVMRGGSFDLDARSARSGYHHGNAPRGYMSNLGLRAARALR